MGKEDHKIIIGWLGLLSCCLLSCAKDKPSISHTLPSQDSNKVYVVCEGNYGNGDASLYVYEPKQDSVFGDIYQTVNNLPLGDVFQSMQRIGDNFFLCINNSNKIVVINTGNWLLVHTIAVPQPRYILPVNSSKAYVSSLYGNKVYIINPQTASVTGSITLPAQNPEGMLLYNGDAYICTWDTASNFIYKVNTSTDAITQNIQVAGYAPQEIVLDKEQNIWVLSGNQPENKAGALTRIDPSTGDILKAYHFGLDADRLKPVFNITRDTLYFIDANYYSTGMPGGIYRMDIHDEALPALPFITAQTNQYFWALGIDPARGNIYAGDPKGFTQRGIVYVYRPDGTIVTHFTTGLGPGHFYFDE